MPEYLTRPVFEQPIDWSRRPTTAHDYDLRALQVGFGPVVYRPLQEYVARAFDVEVWLQDEDELQDCDDFFAALYGRVQGFWIPQPAGAFRIESNVDANRVDIHDQQLAETLADHPAVHVALSKDGETTQYTAINSVTDLGNGLERVTFADSVDVDETWTARPLLYVRLADPKIDGQFDREGRLTQTLRLLELPTEYAEAETGQRPVVLYEFYANFGGTEVRWRYTSYWQPITAAGETWESFPMTHGGLTQTTSGDREETTVEAVLDAAHPLALFVPFTLPVPLWLVIYEATLDNLDGLSVVFTGQVEKVRPTGPRLVATASSILDVLSRKVMRFMIGPRCNYHLFQADTCKLDRDDWEIAATIDSINGRQIVISGAELDGLPTDWFSEGWLEIGSGAEFEVRTIVKDEATDTEEHTLTLNFPLNHAEVSDALVLLPGDDRTLDTCTDKFSNEDEFGGHKFVPGRNLTLQAIQASPSGGGKKG